MTREVSAKLDQLAELLRDLPPERVDLLLRPSERMTVYLTPQQKDDVRAAAEDYELTLSGFASRVIVAVAQAHRERKRSRGA